MYINIDLTICFIGTFKIIIITITIICNKESLITLICPLVNTNKKVI